MVVLNFSLILILYERDGSLVTYTLLFFHWLQKQLAIVLNIHPSNEY